MVKTTETNFNELCLYLNEVAALKNTIYNSINFYSISLLILNHFLLAFSNSRK